MERPRHVVVLVPDSLRWDSVHGQDGARLPYVTGHGIDFREARAPGCWTLPATASLFTGLYPHEHGADTQSRGLRADVPTLAEKMRVAGYGTYQVTANVATTHIFGLHRGFDEIREIWKIVPPRHRRLHKLAVMFGKPRLRRRIVSTDWIRGRLSEDIEAAKVWLQDTVEEVFDQARAIMAQEERRGRGAFLFLNLMETHFPYHVADSLQALATTPVEKLREGIGLYHLVNQTFMATGRDPVPPDVMDRLRARQRRSWERLAPHVDAFVRELHEGAQNLVLLQSDHGDCFGEQGWAYHFSNVTDGGNRVPLWWLPPGSAARRVDVPVSARDVHHAILHACGIGGWALADEPGRSRPLMQSAWYNSQGRTRAEYRYNQVGFVEGDRRFVRRAGRWLSAPPSTLRHEAPFAPLPRGVDPVEEIADAGRRAEYRRLISDFEAYSSGIAP